MNPEHTKLLNKYLELHDGLQGGLQTNRKLQPKLRAFVTSCAPSQPQIKPSGPPLR